MPDSDDAKTRWNNPPPVLTAADIEGSPGTREEKAARFVVVRHVPGIPRRAYLTGENDHAPVLKGVRDLTAAAFAVVDAIHAEQNAEPAGRVEAGRKTMDAVDRMEAILFHHGCE